MREERQGGPRLKRAIGRSDTGRVREGNEDRFVVHEEGDTVLLAVADGVGGGPGGEIAAEAAVQELSARFFATPADRPLEERLADSMREANTAVLRAASTAGKPQAASTLVAVVVRAGHALIANLGDSRAYLVRDGVPRQLTEDHSGDIAHGITRFVGDPRGVQPDVFVEELRTGDRLVLCSDGLTRHVEPAEIAARATGDDLDRAADDLVALANSRGGEDNVTVIVYAADPRVAAGGSPRRAVGLWILIGVVTLVLAGTIALLASLAPLAPVPSTSPTASPSASGTPSPSASASPTPTPTPTSTPTATVTEGPTPTP